MKPQGIKYPRVNCPGCRQAMKPSNVKPLAFAEELADISYKCQRCGAETVRTIKIEDWKKKRDR